MAISVKKIKKDIPALVGVIATASLSYVTCGMTIPVLTTLGNIGTSVAANLLSEFTPNKIKKWKNVHPNDLNHSIKKLFIQSIEEALTAISKSFSDQPNATVEEKKRAEQLVKEIQKYLKDILLNQNQIQLSKKNIEQFLYDQDGEDTIIPFVENQFEILGVTEPFQSFLAQKLPSHIQIYFGEGLKDPANSDAWIAFQRMLTEEIRNDIKQIADNQQNIREDLADLKFEKSGLSKEQIDEIHQLIKILNDKKLVKIKMNEGINQSLTSIEKKANEVIRITTNTNITVGQLKTMGGKIQRQNQLNHRIIYSLATFLLLASVFLGYIFMNQPFSVTIHITDWKGRDSKQINNSNSQIKILNKISKSITDGEVEFSDISAKYKNQKIRIEFLPCENCGAYELMSDSVILRKDKKYELKIKVKGLDQIYGYVTDIKGNPIDSAKVEIAGTKSPLYAYTNNVGRYQIIIPIEQQEWIQRVNVTKQNYSVGDNEKYLGGNTNDWDFKLTPLNIGSYE
jgi:hypothetical protein